MKPTVFVPENIADTGMDLLRSHCDFASDLSQADAVIVRLFKITAAQLTPRLKVIAKHGVGVDNIDVKAATAQRVPVVFTPTARRTFEASEAGRDWVVCLDAEDRLRELGF